MNRRTRRRDLDPLERERETRSIRHLDSRRLSPLIPCSSGGTPPRARARRAYRSTRRRNRRRRRRSDSSLSMARLRPPGHQSPKQPKRHSRPHSVRLLFCALSKYHSPSSYHFSMLCLLVYQLVGFGMEQKKGLPRSPEPSPAALEDDLLPERMTYGGSSGCDKPGGNPGGRQASCDSSCNKQCDEACNHSKDGYEDRDCYRSCDHSCDGRSSCDASGPDNRNSRNHNEMSCDEDGDDASACDEDDAGCGKMSCDDHCDICTGGDDDYFGWNPQGTRGSYCDEVGELPSHEMEDVDGSSAGNYLLPVCTRRCDAGCDHKCDRSWCAAPFPVSGHLILPKSAISPAHCACALAVTSTATSEPAFRSSGAAPAVGPP